MLIKYIKLGLAPYVAKTTLAKDVTISFKIKICPYLLACNLSNPNACREYHILLESNQALQACTMGAQPFLAQWIDDHPNLRVARWRCASPDSEDQKS